METHLTKTLYLAGPMSSHPEDFNFPAFFAAEEYLSSQGWSVSNPAKMDCNCGYTLEKLKLLTPTEFQEFLKGAMKRDLEAIQGCDALVLLPGWESSKGARAEKAVAEWGGKRVGYLWSERGDGFRLTWEDERQHDPRKLRPNADGWIPHVPGDPMPCDGDTLVDVQFKCGEINLGNAASVWAWEGFGLDYNIIAWRPHQPKQPLPYNSDERAEWGVEKPSQAATAPLHPNDPKGAAGALKAPLWLLPPSAMSETAWVHKHGADKYGPFNWREGSVCASTYISAIMRHLDLWRDGEDIDKESGRSHIAHIAASCNILMDAQHCGKLVDDRSKLD